MHSPCIGYVEGLPVYNIQLFPAARIRNITCKHGFTEPFYFCKLYGITNDPIVEVALKHKTNAVRRQICLLDLELIT